jgi:hypothetical protein
VLLKGKSSSSSTRGTRCVTSNEEKLLADPVCGTEVNELIQSQENKNTKKARPWQQEFSETGEEKDTYAF